MALNGDALLNGVREGVSLIDLYDKQMRRFNLKVLLSTWVAAGIGIVLLAFW